MPETLDRLNTALGNRYRIERELGAGGMATAARHGAPPESDLVANRVFVASFQNETGDPAMDPVGRIMAAWLARALQDLNTVEVVDPQGTLVSETFDLVSERDARHAASAAECAERGVSLVRTTTPRVNVRLRVGAFGDSP